MVVTGCRGGKKVAGREDQKMSRKVGKGIRKKKQLDQLERLSCCRRKPGVRLLKS